MNKFFLACSVVVCAAVHAESNSPLLMQQPTLNATHIVFSYGGDLWSVSREGGAATRLTSGLGQKCNPSFSPDGKWIAFTARYNGNANVYVMPAGGGQPQQLTYHPGPDTVQGWTPDGKNVLFRSSRDSYSIRFEQLYTVSVNGGFPQALPLPMGYEGSYSANGDRIAYTPLPREVFFLGDTTLIHAYWAHYHGGLAPKIWIADLANSRVEAVPHENASDFNPMWVGDKIFFLSARTEPISLYAYDTRTKKVTRAVDNTGMDIMSASAANGAIVYEQFGSLHLYTVSTGQHREVPITITGDFPEARPHFASAADRVLNSAISPTGERAAFEAHGDILTVPAEKGSIRNITNSPAVADRSPAWSPDGSSIAYFSDRSGEYELYIKDQAGLRQSRSINLGNPPSFYVDPVWSPDSKKILYLDKHLNVWYVDLANPQPVKIDTDTYFAFGEGLNPAWSPDSRWIAYTKMISNRMRAVFVYSLDTGKATQVTDGLSDAEYAAFDKGGKYLYFTVSTNSGPAGSPLDMSSDGREITRSVYITVLAKGVPSPLAPESNDEKAEAQNAGTPPAAGGQKKAPEPVRIDFDGISQRILALPLPPARYIQLEAGKPGEIFLLEQQPGRGESATLVKFSLADRHPLPLLAGIQAAKVSFNGEKFLFQQGDKWGIASTQAPAKPGEGMLNLDSMQVWVEPREEWKQMYHETWRIERDYFYATNYHGLDIAAAEREYARYLPGIASREDLNYLFREMLGKLSVGHMFAGGGDVPAPPAANVGLLGADYKIENGRYRFARVYSGENWNPELRAPLTAPGVDVREGEYLLAVNGRELHASDNVHRLFLNTAEQQVVLKIGPNPDGSGAREVTVVPIANEIPLRHRNWVYDNVRKVDQLSGGRIAYVYLPDTAEGGYTSFNRYFFAQADKQAVILDDRFNSGGQAADYIIQYLQRTLWNYWDTRDGAVTTEPGKAIFGPKAMLINQYAGSGGDLIPWFFHHVGVGQLIGERTWGGEVGITGYPPLIDGGVVTAPSLAFFTTEGKWGIENEGVPPDVEVEMDPNAWREGHDVQLEKAVQVLLDELGQHPLPKPQVPPFPNYYRAR